jgi:hypothetical protein
MKHKKIIWGLCLSFAVLAFCNLSLSGAKIIQSDWAAVPALIDGSNADWEGVTFTEYKPTKVDYAFRNDAENLYALFVFKSPREFMSSIQSTGMTVWLNTEGKNRKDYGIRFRIVTVSADDYIVLLEKMLNEPLPEEKKQAIKAKKAYQVFNNEVIDKEGEPVSIVTGDTAPAFNFSGGQEAIIYEFKIPLKKGGDYPVGIGTEPGNTIKVAFEWGGTLPEDRQEKLRQQIATGAQGRADSATSSATSERSGGSMGRMDTMSRLRSPKYIFWSDVQLADNR